MLNAALTSQMLRLTYALRLTGRVCSLLLTMSAASLSAADRPNFVVFFADDHSWRDTTVYAASDARTPNMQRVADAGLTFTHAFVASPSCAPSRGAMLTGLMPARNGAEANHTFPREAVRTLPDYLHELGYEVAAFGKVCHGVDVERHGFDHHDRQHDVVRVARYLIQRDKSRPLCLLVGTQSPHVPWPANDGYDPAQLHLPPKWVDTPETREFRARYLTDVTKADAELGQIFDLVQTQLAADTLFMYTSDHGSQWPFGKWNLYDEGIRVPLLAVWPGTIPAHQRTAAMVSWVDLLPTFIEAAGGAAPSDIDGQSFLSVLKGSEKSHREQIFATHSGDGKMNVYPMRSVRTERFKYIRNLHPEYQFTTHIDHALGNDRLHVWYSWLHAAQSDAQAAETVRRYYQRPAEELYDLQSDPEEQLNLAQAAEYSARLRELRAELDQWLLQQQDPLMDFSQPQWIGADGPAPVALVNLRLRRSEISDDAQAWQFTTDAPKDTWIRPDFNDANWHVGRGGFGTEGTPGARLGSLWNTRQIWLRRWFALQNISPQAALMVHHDEDAQIFINGQQVADLRGYSTDYQLVPLSAEQRAALRLGSNLLAVHCRQTSGGQYIDVQLVDAADLASSRGPDGKPLVFRPSLRTRWAEQMDPQNPWPEYPRPQLVRDNWINLNGLWEYAVLPRSESLPQVWDGRIVVPFAIESQLSGVTRSVGEDEALWYRRSFARPVAAGDSRWLLHFGAVDWEATVWVNGQQVGVHRGGFDPFAFDITDALTAADQQHIVVRVWDPTDRGPQPIGKQRQNPGGIFYTAVTGLWQTVWLEPVADLHIERLKITPDIQRSQVNVQVRFSRHSEQTPLTAEVLSDGQRVAEYHGSNSEFTLSLPDAHLWSPDDPFLYDLKISTDGGDTVKSYFGMRQITRQKDAHGIDRLALNHRILFHCGPLDQGWWPDGLYTAPTDDALRYDIEITKRLGFNATRKHVKVEPARWYYWCDKLGLLVWQDMPSSHATNTPVGGPEGVMSDENSQVFVAELTAMIENLYNHPSIVIWVPFNEGWGQHRTNEILRHVQTADATRLVDGPSGWLDLGHGDMIDMHRYPGPAMHAPLDGRVSVLSEFGGVKMAVPQHMWNERGWGYIQVETQGELQTRYQSLIDELRPLVEAGLSAAIYTQLTDVESEVNGLLTYDRSVVKLNEQETFRRHRLLIEPTAP